MPRVPKSPIAVGLALYKAWTKLPPARRRQVLEAARKHGPAVAAKAREVAPTVVRAVAKRKRP